MSHYFKELVDIVINSIKKYSNYSFSVGPKMLFSILSGEETKIIVQLNMINDPYFGCLRIDDKKKFFSLINSLKDNSIINISEKENDYNRIVLLKDKLDDNDYKIIFAGMKL